MSQSDFGNITSPQPGADFFNNKLEPWRDALHTMHRGNTRPAYVQSGLMWIDDSNTPWELKVFQGSDDIVMGTLDPSTLVFMPTSVPDGDKGDITVSDSGGVWTLDGTAITGKTTATVATGDYMLFSDTDDSGTPKKATVDEVGDAIASVARTFTGAQVGSATVLTSTSNSVAVDMALNNNFTHTLTENTTLANPSNATAMQCGQIAITQHASSAKTLAFASNWKEITGDTPAVSTTTSAKNIISYFVQDSSTIWYKLNTGGVA